MARFTRRDEHLELVLAGCELVEHNAFGVARQLLHDERAARIAYYRRIAELLEERWHRRSAFVADLMPDPLPFVVDDDDARAVYRDFLLEREDPRGELAVLRAATVPDLRAISTLEKTRGVELFGPFAMLSRAWREHVVFSWRAGWIDDIFVRGVLPQLGEVVHAALHAPMARFARTLTLDEQPADLLAPCACLARITIRSH